MSRLLIQLSHVYKSFGTLSLFHDLSLSIHQGECFALIGENGVGKTTLLSLLIGTIQPDEGAIRRMRALSIGSVPQIIPCSETNVLVKAYLEDEQIVQIERQLAACLEESRLDEWEMLHEQYEQYGGYRRLPLEKIVHQFALELYLELPMRSLSSGQRVRVALAKAFLSNPDLLLLDEPTNHLDHDTIVWLKEMILSRQGATVVVSHDRKFMNDTCSCVLELKKGSLNCYGGNYDFYLAEKERLLEKQVRDFQSQQEDKKLLIQQIKEITFAKPKVSPPSDRNIMAYDKRGEKHQKSLQRTLNDLKQRLEEMERHPLSHPRPKSVTGLFFPPVLLSSAIAIEFENVSKRFSDKKVFSNFSRTLYRGDRTILKGANGCGKTTLLRCAMGLLGLDEGHVRLGTGAKVSYLDQEVSRVCLEETPAAYFARRFSLSSQDVRRELHKAALDGEDLLFRPFSMLSVGQRKRLMLLSLVLERPNVLLLDEPTNHLDLMTLEALEKALLQFEGAILAVSHDARFIEKIGLNEWKIMA